VITSTGETNRRSQNPQKETPSSFVHHGTILTNWMNGKHGPKTKANTADHGRHSQGWYAALVGLPGGVAWRVSEANQAGRKSVWVA
jgi:hypothetical protein